MRCSSSKIVATLAVLLPVLTSCTTIELPKAAVPAGRSIAAAWARPADSGATGGAYVTVVNADSTPLELVSVSTSIAAAAELHETMQHDGMAHMAARATISIAARDSLVMKPGGLHIMLPQLLRALRVNDTVPLTLRFSNGDSLVARVLVQTP